MSYPYHWLPNQGVTAPKGFLAGSGRGEIKTEGDDVALLIGPPGTTAAGVFTTNQVKAAPVLVSAQNLAQGKARAIIVNAGNANCCTGSRGLEGAQRMTQLAAEKLEITPEEVLVCSTGIIGHQLPMGKIEQALNDLQLGKDDEKVARAFMTTDTVPKFCAASLEIDGHLVTVGGQAKGVGMIGPNMAPLTLHATMLAFLTTDAQIEATLLQSLLERVVGRTFNSVTVDGDTSTNDTAILLASGESGYVVSEDNAPAFLALLEEVCTELSRKIARDGEGATKLIEIQVAEAATDEDAKKIALTIANSPLVKTAIYGRDPNWGRIAMAAGRAGVTFDPKKLSFSLGHVGMFENGEPLDFDLSAAEQVLEADDVLISLNLGAGNGQWKAWTCDFSYDYVKINAEYHT